MDRKVKVIKKKSKKTYEGKDGKSYHFINYFLQLDNGLRIGIKTFDVNDLNRLDAIAEYER